jgi:6-pyruvoyl-tetrahydropterin synthase
VHGLHVNWHFDVEFDSVHRLNECSIGSMGRSSNTFEHADDFVVTVTVEKPVCATHGMLGVQERETVEK